MMNLRHHHKILQIYYWLFHCVCAFFSRWCSCCLFYNFRFSLSIYSSLRVCLHLCSCSPSSFFFLAAGLDISSLLARFAQPESLNLHSIWIFFFILLFCFTSSSFFSCFHLFHVHLRSVIPPSIRIPIFLLQFQHIMRLELVSDQFG